jgi:hypothetical protein
MNRLVPEFDTFAINGMKAPLAFSGCEALFPIMTTVLRDWSLEKRNWENQAQPIITLQKREDCYERRSQWLPEPARFQDPVDTVCDFIVDLIHAYNAEQKKDLCLHGAAVELKTGLMVFPSTYRTGKSLLSIKLASRGARIFSDDVLPIQAGANAGTALGILPRLRRPLPETAGDGLKRFIENRLGPQNKRYRYICLDSRLLAPRGTEAPVEAITILRRETGDKPSLKTATVSDVLRELILRNFARQHPGIDILDRLHAVVEQAACYTLAYDTLDQATALLEENFGIKPKGEDP